LLTVIAGGLTSQLQPLDVSVNKPFKGVMHEEWAKWIEAPPHHVTPAGRVKWPSISNVCEWVKNSWQRVKSEDYILDEESDTSSENNHEDDLSGSDDNFLGLHDELIILWLLILVCNNPVFFQ
jgi:hypothetical protein